jgi:hypothetical protein
MINYTTYMTRIQAKIGESKAPDGIKEQLWADIVIPELNSISKDVANELQKEGLSFRKSWGEQKLKEAPNKAIGIGSSSNCMARLGYA